MDDRTPDLLRPTLTAGLLFGAASGLPYIGMLNACCCLLVVGCGFAAAAMYGKDCRRSGVPFRPGQGAMVGLVAGAFQAMTSTLVSAVSRLAVGNVDAELVFGFLSRMPNVTDEQRETLRQAIEQPFTVASFILGFFMAVLLGAIFSTVGGLIGGFVFAHRPETPVPPPPAAPPPGPWDSPSGP